MYRYVLKRIGFMAITVFAVCAITFFLMNVIPGGTAEMILKHTVVGLEESATQEQIAEISDRYDLSDPLYVQFFRWAGKAIFSGDIGSSYVYRLPVIELLALRLPATVILALSSMLIAVAGGIPLGTYAALKENRLTDSLLRIVSLLCASMPGFWVGLLFILLFAVTLKLVPVTGYGGVENLLMPAFALSLHTMAVVIRVTRTSVLETLGQEYVRFATAKGLPMHTIVSRHVFRNAMLPVITVLGFQLGHLLGGTMVIENIFSWPGVGSLLVSSISSRDIPVVQGCVLAIVVMFLLVNFFVDLLYVYVDPRIKYG